MDEAAFLEAVLAIQPLADSDDDVWDDDAAWETVHRLMAAARVVGERGWRSAVGPLYERAALGDLYEVMRNLRHGPEQAFAGDVDAFAAVLEPLTAYPRAGTRQWAVHELGILRAYRSFPFLLRARDDPVPDVRADARGRSSRCSPTRTPKWRPRLAGLDGDDER